MFKKRTIFMAMFAMILSLVILPHGTVFAQLADGTYNVPYEMKEANSNNTSIADGYFQSPAKVTVNGGNATVQFTVTSANMVKSLGVSESSMSVVSEGNDTRTYSFQTAVSNLSNPITMDMHIVVPKGTPGLEAGYDMNHKARAVFNLNSAEEVGGPAPTNESSDESPAAEDNPKTGDNSQIMLYALLLVGSAGALFVVRRLRTASN